MRKRPPVKLDPDINPDDYKVFVTESPFENSPDGYGIEFFGESKWGEFVSFASTPQGVIHRINEHHRNMHKVDREISVREILEELGAQ